MMIGLWQNELRKIEKTVTASLKEQNAKLTKINLTIRECVIAAFYHFRWGHSILHICVIINAIKHDNPEEGDVNRNAMQDIIMRVIYRLFRNMVSKNYSPLYK